MLEELLMERRLPDLFRDRNGEPVETKEAWAARREELKQIIQEQMFGFCQVHVKHVEGIVEKHDDRTIFGGKAVYDRLKIHVDMEEGEFEFPCHLVLPKAKKEVPIFVYIAFEPGHVEELLPTEEIIDGGFGVAAFCYQDIGPDGKDDCKRALGVFGGRCREDAWGKIAMWAWSASRIVDYLETREEIDKARIAIAGHSRAGKGALLAGGLDERFSLVISNDSGGGGAAIFRGKEGEMVKNFSGGSSALWFAPNFVQYARREEEMPFDMHFLTALTVPRNLYIASATEDLYADPKSEFLNAVETSKAYELFGKKGLVTPDAWPKADEPLHEGNLGYHLRTGSHFLSRYDWQQFMAYRNHPEHIC